jgi:hypothetical protein
VSRPKFGCPCLENQRVCQPKRGYPSGVNQRVGRPKCRHPKPEKADAPLPKCGKQPFIRAILHWVQCEGTFSWILAAPGLS